MFIIKTKVILSQHLSGKLYIYLISPYKTLPVGRSIDVSDNSEVISNEKENIRIPCLIKNDLIKF